MADYLAGQGALWAQIDGANSQPQFLGDHELDDLERSRGGAKSIFAPSPRGPSRYDGLTIYNQESGSVSTTIETGMAAVAAWLEGVTVPMNLYIHIKTCGRMDVWTDYERVMILEQAIITSENETTEPTKKPKVLSQPASLP